MITLTTFLFGFICTLSSFTQAQHSLDNLGERISNQVQQSLRPLDNLGAQINNQVQQQLVPLNDLGARINNQVQRNVAPLNNLGAQINGQVQQQVSPFNNLGAQLTGNVQNQLAPLQNLGERINQQVYQGLEPVRILESIVRVKQGSRGRTVVTFSPIDKQFIIRNGQLLQCSGNISDSDGSCSGELNKLNFDKKEDFCFAPSKSVINQWYCISTTGSTTTAFANGKIICRSNDGSPNLLIEVSDYKELCKNVETASYKYYTNYKLQHIGNGLECSGHNPQICTYSETLDSGSNISITNGNKIFISTSNY